MKTTQGFILMTGFTWKKKIEIKERGLLLSFVVTHKIILLEFLEPVLSY